MSRFDYKVALSRDNFLSSTSSSGDIKRPVAWGSNSSFNSPLLNGPFGDQEIQLVAEPIVDNAIVGIYSGVTVKYIHNGVYSVVQGDNAIRVVANTGPVSFKFIPTTTELYVIIDGVQVKIQWPDGVQPVGASGKPEFSINPDQGVIFDKLIVGHIETSVDEVVVKTPMVSVGESGMLSTLSYDKLYDPALVLADDMDIVEDYYVACRKLTEANTSVVFYSDTTKIEKSIDGEEWLPVNKIEYHGEDAWMYRSKDRDFALRFYDTNITEFIARGITTNVTGEIYKIGNDIGSYFTHDCYRIEGGGITISAEEMSSVSILGYLPDSIVESLSPQVDYGQANIGKMHLYTFTTTEPLTIEADEIFISAVGVNLNHEDTMDHIVGMSQISYADEISNLVLGESINSDKEYAVLDLQWGL